MRYIVFAVAVLILGWGIWIFKTDQPTKQTESYLQVCNKVYDTPGVRSQGSFGDELVCNGNAFKSGDDLERNAIIGIIVGGIFVLGSGLLIWADWEDAEEHKHHGNE